MLRRDRGVDVVERAAVVAARQPDAPVALTKTVLRPARALVATIASASTWPWATLSCSPAQSTRSSAVRRSGAVSSRPVTRARGTPATSAT